MCLVQILSCCECDLAYRHNHFRTYIWQRINENNEIVQKSKSMGLCVTNKAEERQPTSLEPHILAIPQHFIKKSTKRRYNAYHNIWLV